MMGNAKFKKKEPIGDFAVWTKQVKKNKLAVFNKIYQHYRTLHDENTSLKYACETFGKVLVAVGLAKDAKQTYSVLKHDGKEIHIPNIFMDVWVKKAKKAGIVSVELHEDHVMKFTSKYLNSTSLKLLFAIDTFVAQKADLEINPKEPVTFRTKLIFKKDKVVFFSEKYGIQDMSYNLYYKWFNSLVSVGYLDTKTHSQMTKYAEKGKTEEPSQASIDFYSSFLKFVGSEVKGETEAAKKIKEEYPDYFITEMDFLMKNEVKKLAKLELEVPQEAGYIKKIHDPGRIMVYLNSWGHTVGVDPDFYHLLYTETVKNDGKAPSWANKKIYDFLVKEGGYNEETAAKLAPMLVPFFEYQVAVDSQAAKKIMEQEKKLKGVPKK